MPDLVDHRPVAGVDYPRTLVEFDAFFPDEVSAIAGTLFEKTRKPLRQWFLAVWEVTSTKYGASALDMQRVLGLRSYETAWAWLHKLRRAMVRPGRDRLSGEVEIDETYGH